MTAGMSCKPATWKAIECSAKGEMSSLQNCGNSFIFCDQQSETLDHLLLACVFSKEVWVTVIRLLHLEMGFVSVRDVVAWSGGCSQGS